MKDRQTGQFCSVLHALPRTHLVDSRRDGTSFQNGIEVLRKVVADTNRLGQTLLLDFFHLLPLGLLLFAGFGKERCMDQVSDQPLSAATEYNKLGEARKKRYDVQINIVQLKLLQARANGSGDIGNVGNDFGDHIELLASHAGLFDGNAEFGLGLVDLSAVEVGVAEADSSLGAVDARLVQLRLVTGFVPSGAGAIGQHGDAVPVIELETGDGGVDVGHDEQGCVCCEGEGEGEGSILKPMRGMELEVWDCGKVSKLSGCGAEKSRCSLRC